MSKSYYVQSPFTTKEKFKQVISMQYDLFESEEMQSIRQELVSMKELLLKCNRANFREIGLLKKQVKSLVSENEQIKQIQAKKKAQLIPFFGELMEMSK